MIGYNYVIKKSGTTVRRGCYFAVDDLNIPETASRRDAAVAIVNRISSEAPIWRPFDADEIEVAGPLEIDGQLSMDGEIFRSEIPIT